MENNNQVEEVEKAVDGVSVRDFLLKKFPCLNKLRKTKEIRKRHAEIKENREFKSKVYAAISEEYGEDIANSLKGRGRHDHDMLSGFLLEKWWNQVPEFFEEHCMKNDLEGKFYTTCNKAYSQNIEDYRSFFEKQEWLHFDRFYEEIFKSFSKMQEFCEKIHEEHHEFVNDHVIKPEVINIITCLMNKYIIYKGQFGASVDDSVTLLQKIKSFIKENEEVLSPEEIIEIAREVDFKLSLIE